MLGGPKTFAWGFARKSVVGNYTKHPSFENESSQNVRYNAQPDNCELNLQPKSGKIADGTFHNMSSLLRKIRLNISCESSACTSSHLKKSESAPPVPQSSTPGA